MDWLSRLQRRFGRWCIPHLTEILMGGQALVWGILMFAYAGILPLLSLTRTGLAQGQLWRLVTFVFLPMDSSVLFFLLGLYFLWFVGGALQAAWGEFRYNLYFLTGMLGCILAALLTGSCPSIWLYQSLFLAFAALYPNHTLLLFFVLPIPAKWLGWLTALEMLVFFVRGGLAVKGQIALSLLGFFLFFGPKLLGEARAWVRRERWRRKNRGSWGR